MNNLNKNGCDIEGLWSRKSGFSKIWYSRKEQDGPKFFTLKNDHKFFQINHFSIILFLFSSRDNRKAIHGLGRIGGQKCENMLYFGPRRHVFLPKIRNFYVWRPKKVKNMSFSKICRTWGKLSLPPTCAPMFLPINTE